MEMPMVIDNTAPTLEDVSLSLTGDSLQVTARDNQYVAGVVLYNAAGTQVLTEAGAKQEAKPGETLTYTLDMHQVEGERLLLQVYDYAMNATTYKIKLGGAATVDTKFMAFYLLPNDDWYWDNAGWIGFDEAVKGDVTALAGAMSLGEDGILGIAMGTSEAGGYVDMKGNITGWLNELAFVPCDLAPGAMVDEWSGDIGCGVKYFSQDAVIKLAPAAGIELDPALSPAEKLKVVQARMNEGDAGARAIYETIGVYLGYTLAFYAMFYDINHVLLMGRVTSGEGGDLVLGKAQEVLRAEYPELRMQVNLPDEKSRRVGQSVAAASLPQIG